MTTSTSAATPTTLPCPSRRTSVPTCTAASRTLRSTPRLVCSRPTDFHPNGFSSRVTTPTWSSPGLTKADLRLRVITDDGVQAREAELQAVLDRWWEQHAALVADLPETGSLMTVRRTLLESFTAELQPTGLLDRFQLAGVIVRWWNTNQYDLRTLVAHGFTGVVDGWVTTITTTMEDSDSRTDPLDHKLASELLPSYLAELAAIEARRAQLNAQIKEGSAAVHEDEKEPTDDAETLSPSELALLRSSWLLLGSSRKRYVRNSSPSSARPAPN